MQVHCKLGNEDHLHEKSKAFIMMLIGLFISSFYFETLQKRQVDR